MNNSDRSEVGQWTSWSTHTVNKAEIMDWNGVRGYRLELKCGHVRALIPAENLEERMLCKECLMEYLSTSVARDKERMEQPNE